MPLLLNQINRYLNYVLILLGVWIVLARFSINEDGFVYFRYADNFLNGYGFVYNPGEYVEGFVCPVWILTLAFFKSILADYKLVIKTIAVLAAVSVYSVVIYLTQHCMSGERSFQKTSPVLLLAFFTTFVPFTHYFTSGHETPLAILCASIFCLLIMTKKKEPLPWMAVTIVSVLTRPEFYLISFLCVGYFLLQRKLKLALYLCFTILTMLTVTVFFRIWTYAAFLPNTAILKGAFSFSSDRSWDYYQRMSVYGLPVLFTLCILLLILFRNISLKRERGFILFLGAIYASYAFAATDYMHGRFMVVPATFLFLSLAGILESIRPSRLIDFFPITVICTIMVCNSLSQPRHTRDISLYNPHGYVSLRGETFSNELTLEEQAMGYLLNQVNLGRPLRLSGRTCLSEYRFSQANFTHFFGLTDNVISHVKHKTFLAAHDKSLATIAPYALFDDLDLLHQDLADGLKLPWLANYTVKIGSTNQQVVLLNFSHQMMMQLSKFSNVDRDQFLALIEKRVYLLLQKYHLDGHLKEEFADEVFFLIKKGEGVLNPSIIRRLQFLYKQSASQSKLEKYLLTHKEQFDLLKLQKFNRHRFFENLVLAIKVLNITLPSFNNQWAPGISNYFSPEVGKT